MIGPVHLHCVAVVGECLQDDPSLCPGPGGLPSLILDGNGVSREQGEKVLGVLVELLVLQDLSPRQG